MYMKRSKKIFYILATILEVLLLIGASMINYFTNSKMGMLRHVVYKNYIWEDAYPIVNIEYAAIISLIMLMILVLVIYMKRKKKIVTIINISMLIVVLSFVGFVLIYSTEEIRAFYYVSTMFYLIALIEIIKAFIGVIGCKNQ